MSITAVSLLTEGCGVPLPLHSLSSVGPAGAERGRSLVGKAHLIIAVQIHVAVHRHKGMKGGCLNILTFPPF